MLCVFVCVLILLFFGILRHSNDVHIWSAPCLSSNVIRFYYHYYSFSCMAILNRIWFWLCNLLHIEIKTNTNKNHKSNRKHLKWIKCTAFLFTLFAFINNSIGIKSSVCCVYCHCMYICYMLYAIDYIYCYCCILVGFLFRFCCFRRELKQDHFFVITILFCQSHWTISTIDWK